MVCKVHALAARRTLQSQQKISGAFRTEKGATDFGRIRGYISTARKHGYSVFEALRALAIGQPLSIKDLGG
jgi:transposase